MRLDKGDRQIIAGVLADTERAMTLLDRDSGAWKLLDTATDKLASWLVRH